MSIIFGIIGQKKIARKNNWKLLEHNRLKPNPNFLFVNIPLISFEFCIQLVFGCFAQTPVKICLSKTEDSHIASSKSCNTASKVVHI